MTELPQPLSQPLSIPEPNDVEYCGALKLHVDATDVLRRVFRVHEIIPVAEPGILTLLLPKWLPGYHAPQAPIELLAALDFEALGKRLHWTRHPTEVYAFHVSVPEGAEQIEARFQFLSPTDSSQGRVVVGHDVLNLEWNCVVLYPAGHFSRRITVEAALTLPDEWQLASALPIQSREDATTRFEPIGLDELVDSPVMAGRHYRRVDLDDGKVALNIFADAPHQLEASEEMLVPHREVVTQADLLFGHRPFDRFEALLAMTSAASASSITDPARSPAYPTTSAIGTIRTLAVTAFRTSIFTAGTASTGVVLIPGRPASTSRSATA
jgi:predicted metalloprotease with PDZ domain